MTRQFPAPYKPVIFQTIGFTIAYFITGKVFFIFILLSFIFLFIFLNNAYQSIMKGINFLITTAGNIIKTMLLFVVYLIVIIPISLLLKIAEKKENNTGTFYEEITTAITADRFKKLW